MIGDETNISVESEAAEESLLETEEPVVESVEETGTAIETEIDETATEIGTEIDETEAETDDTEVIEVEGDAEVVQ